MKRTKPKFRVGTCFVVHSRWKEELKRSIVEDENIPMWAFPFPFGTTESFLSKNIGTKAKIIDIKIEDWVKRFDVKSYKIQFFCEEYRNLSQFEKDMVWIEEEDIPIIFDRKLL